ncbi:hypothetical protein D3C76_687770 [compost metagenome]
MRAVAGGAGQAGQGGVRTLADQVAVFVEEEVLVQIAIEANEFGAVGELEAARVVGHAAIQGQLRQTVVRGHVGDRGQLVGLCVQARGEAVATVGQRALLVDVGRRAEAQRGVQVLEVVRVADLGEVDLGQPAGVETTGVLPAVQPALVGEFRLAFAVVVLVVQVGGGDLAFAAAGQVAEFAFHLQATLGHVTRVQRGVVVRRQVEVVRGDQGETGVRAAAQAGRQEAGLAAVIDREIDIGGVEHRNVLHLQDRVGRGAETGGRIQFDVVAPDEPGVAVRFATGVGAILELDDGVFLALGVQRAAAHRGLVHDVLGVVDLRFAVVQLQLGVVADHQCAVVAQLDVADQFAAVLRLVQAGLVGLDLHAALAQHDVAGEGGDLFFLLVAGNLGRDEGRCLVVRGLVVHPRAGRLDIGAAAVRADFRHLGGGELLARYPVQMAVIFAARFQATAAGLGDQLPGLCAGFAAAGRCGAGADGAGAMLRARRNGCTGLLRGACPGTAGRFAIELLCSVQVGERLNSQQAAGYQQREFSTEHW